MHTAKTSQALSFLQRLQRSIGRRGILPTVRQICLRLEDYRNRLVSGKTAYERYFVAQAPDDKALKRMRDCCQVWEQRPLISVLLPVCDPELGWLVKAIQSVRAQAYENWQLCIADDHSVKPEIGSFISQLVKTDKRVVGGRLSSRSGISATTNFALGMAAGEFVILLDHDDELSPDALYELACVIRNEAVDVVYSDEDKITLDGHLETPTYKPGFSRYWLLSCNYMIHFVSYRTKLLRAIGGFRVEFDGSQDYDVALRISRKTDRIRHIPKVLYHWRMVPGSAANPAKREKSWAYEAARRALGDHIDELGLAGSLSLSEPDGYYRLSPNLELPWTVSIVVSETVKQQWPKKIPADSRIEIIEAEFCQPDSPDNIGSLNAAAKRATGDVIVFLSDAIPPDRASWPFELAYWAMRPDVAAVGGALCRGNSGLVAQVGFILGGENGIRTEQCSFYRGELGPLGVNLAVHEVSAVGAGCFAVNRQHFDFLKGFDESLAAPYHTVDFCLRAEELGLVALCDPRITFRSKKGRRPLLPSNVSAAFVKRWAPRLAFSDKYYNQNYSDIGPLYRLRCYDNPSEWNLGEPVTRDEP